MSSAALARLISARGGGACEGLEILEGRDVQALLPGFNGGAGKCLKVLRLLESESSCVPLRALPEALAVLSGLRHLSVHRDVIAHRGRNRHSWTLLWRALGAGACPHLEPLRADGGRRLSYFSLDLPGLAFALEERRDLGIASLELLSLQLGYRQLEGLAQVLGLASASAVQVELTLVVAQRGTAHLGVCLRRSPGLRLRLLHVSTMTLGPTAQDQDWPECSGLILALVESGKTGRS